MKGQVETVDGEFLPKYGFKRFIKTIILAKAMKGQGCFITLADLDEFKIKLIFYYGFFNRSQNIELIILLSQGVNLV